MMKKIVSLSLALLLALSLTACGSKQEAPAPAEPPVQRGVRAHLAALKP